MWCTFVTWKKPRVRFISGENKCDSFAVSGDSPKQPVWWKPFLLFNNKSGSSWSGPEDTDIGVRDSLGYSNQSVYPHCKPSNANAPRDMEVIFPSNAIIKLLSPDNTDEKKYLNQKVFLPTKMGLSAPETSQLACVCLAYALLPQIAST